MTYRSLIPNMLTSSNLVFGMCSIFSTMRGDFFWAALFILIALVADGLDGRAARFFSASSEIGKEMDSLCDLVSFGVAPGILAYVFCMHDFSWFGVAVSVCFALCGAWRLARFNVNVNIVHGYFMGLAIPAGGCFVATSTLLMQAIHFDPHCLGWSRGRAKPFTWRPRLLSSSSLPPFFTLDARPSCLRCCLRFLPHTQRLALSIRSFLG